MLATLQLWWNQFRAIVVKLWSGLTDEFFGRSVEEHTLTIDNCMFSIYSVSDRLTPVFGGLVDKFHCETLENSGLRAGERMHGMITMQGVLFYPNDYTSGWELIARSLSIPNEVIVEVSVPGLMPSERYSRFLCAGFMMDEYGREAKFKVHEILKLGRTSVCSERRKAHK